MASAERSGVGTGFAKLSTSGRINNSNDTYDPDWEYTSEFDWPRYAIDDEALADADTLKGRELVERDR